MSGRAEGVVKAPKVLVVVDDLLVHWSPSEAPRRAGYPVEEAASAGEAWAAIREGAPNLVFLDVRLPDRDGLAVLGSIHESRPDVPVVVMTAGPTPDVRRRAPRLGAHACLEEPIGAALVRDTATPVLRAQPTVPPDEGARGTREGAHADV